jgi:hypothetical protein
MEAQVASKHILMQGILVLLSIVPIPMARAEIVISPEMVAQIEALTNRPFHLYPVDQAKCEAVFAKVDDWAKSQIPLNSGTRVREKRSSRLTWVKETSQNTPIFAAGSKGDGLVPPGPFRIKYVKKPQGRAFVKALRVLHSKGLDKKRVAQLARRFVKRHGFLLQTQVDKLGNHLVVNRVCRTEERRGKKSSKQIVSQRAILKRSLDGLEVFNSRQVVDLHPQSGEILAYKQLHWAPADHAHRQALPPLSRDEVLAAIQQSLRPTNKPYQAIAVRTGMYQTAESLVPVLAVRVERAADQPEQPPLQRVLLVPLVKNLNQPERPQPREWPRFAGH